MAEAAAAVVAARQRVRVVLQVRVARAALLRPVDRAAEVAGRPPAVTLQRQPLEMRRPQQETLPRRMHRRQAHEAPEPDGEERFQRRQAPAARLPAAASPTGLATARFRRGS